MKTLTSDLWKRRGISLLFDARALAEVAKPHEVLSIREWIRSTGAWPETPPSNEGRAMVVAGLGACIDLLGPAEGEEWLRSQWARAVMSFQAEYDLEASLVFWIPDGRSRIKMNSATETYTWACAPPHKDAVLPLGRLLWSGAESGAARIIDPSASNADPDGPAWIGLHLQRLS